MTIQDKRTTVENKLVGAEKLRILFNDNSHILLGGGLMGLFFIDEFYSTQTFVTSLLFIFSFVFRKLASLFNSIKDEALKEYRQIEELNKWIENEN